MENEVIRHIHKHAMAMYVMFSVPEAKEENIYKSPIILGCFKTKDDAKAAWKARTPEYKQIKAKTVRTYYFNLQTDVPEIPETVFFVGYYRVSFRSGELHLHLTPADSYVDIESYNNLREWLKTQNTRSFRELCERSGGWETFYASNEGFCVECPVNKLVKIEVPLADVDYKDQHE